MKVTKREVGDVVVLSPTEKSLNGDGNDSLLVAVAELVAGGKLGILLDMSGAPHLDGSGAGQIIGSFARVKRGRGEFKLCAMTKEVFDFLNATKFFESCAWCNTLHSALESFLDKPAATPVPLQSQPPAP